MRIFRQKRRAIALFACLTILLNALAPAISHATAVAHGNQVPWLKICSQSNTTPLNLIDASNKQGSNKSDDSRPMSMEDCGYCLNHAGSFGMTHQLALNLPDLDLSYSLPYLFYHAPGKLFVWASSNPRAPPVFS
ncbi:DUF2946 domain-containing protein [Methyloradius palustris]|uniref:DUF2946 domain-containing protein n=1 Tax=Methyloradius palustris TaxID=2778876 RepID=A0A8D5FYV6_9PROT|nr:DUF2946 domain-containing protein [Methyloradius palustris]BCM24709.1 hypothetical protein ZMTM_09680 [Methyloradius palustris]